MRRKNVLPYSCHFDDMRTKTKVEHSPLMVFTNSSEVDSTGRVVKKAKYVKYNPKEELKNLRVNDFAIETLQSVGAELKETTLSMSSIEHIENAEKQFAKMDKVYNSKSK